MRRIGLALLLVLGVGSPAGAGPDGLQRALEGQQRDLQSQSDDSRRRLDSQRQQLQQQQEGTLQFQLLQPSQPFRPAPTPSIPTPPSVTCTHVGGTFFCR